MPGCQYKVAVTGGEPDIVVTKGPNPVPTKNAAGGYDNVKICTAGICPSSYLPLGTVMYTVAYLGPSPGGSSMPSIYGPIICQENNGRLPSIGNAITLSSSGSGGSSRSIRISPVGESLSSVIDRSTSGGGSQAYGSFTDFGDGNMPTRSVYDRPTYDDYINCLMGGGGESQCSNPNISYGSNRATSPTNNEKVATGLASYGCETAPYCTTYRPGQFIKPPGWEDDKVAVTVYDSRANNGQGGWVTGYTPRIEAFYCPPLSICKSYQRIIYPGDPMLYSPPGSPSVPSPSTWSQYYRDITPSTSLI